jgi:hypothetical protein
MYKNEVYSEARTYSERNTIPVYVWENDFGEWKWSVDFPIQYSEIICTFINGEES